MKIFFIVSLMILLVGPASWAELGPIHKLSRGTINVISSPVEIPKQTREYWIRGSEKTDHILVWLFSGAVWGTVMMVKRVAVGIYDITTFPLEYPSEYKPVINPEYVFNDWPSRQKFSGNVYEK